MNFYSIASIIAFVILIICLIGIGILMQYQNAGMKFPLHPNQCPDLWTLDPTNNKCVSSTQNIGTLATNSNGFDKDNNNNYKIDPLTSAQATCDKHKLARSKGINWDGVSNYNGCN
jgi:hypothetical protein